MADLLFAGARAGSIFFLVASLMVAATAAVPLYRGRNSAGEDEGDGGEDVDFDDLGR